MTMTAPAGTFSTDFLDSRTSFTFETVDSTFNRNPSSESENGNASFYQRFYDNFFSEKKLNIILIGIDMIIVSALIDVH